MAVAIDSSVLVRYFTKDDTPLLKQATELLEKAKPGSIILDRIIIAEFGYVLRSVYGVDKTQLVDVYKSLLASDAFSIPDRDLVEITIDLFATEKPLSFEDCWLLALKRSGKANNVLTFDSALLKRL